jgi:hypothetical protein
MTFEIQVFRHGLWLLRGDGEVSATITREALIAELPRHCLQYQHRLLIDGEVVAEADPSSGGEEPPWAPT